MATVTSLITNTTRPTSPNARSVGAGSQTDIASPIDSGSVGGAGSGTLVDAPVYPHTSTFESDQMAVTISSPHQELTFPNGNDGAIVRLPVFSAKDSIGGTISVNPAAFASTSNAKVVVSLEGALYWSEPRPPPVERPSTGSKRRHAHKESASTIALSTTVEKKHVFLFSSLSLPLSEDDVPTSNTALESIMANKQQAMAAMRRRMSYGKAEATKLLERARKKKSSGFIEDFGFSGSFLGSLGLGNGKDSDGTPTPGVLSPSPPEGTSPAGGATADPMLTAAPWVSKTFMFHLPLQQGDGSTTLLPPSVDLRAEAAEREKGKTKLVEDVRIQYKLVAKYEGGSPSKNLEVPIIFEPGSDPESFYSTPQPPIKWRETPMEVASRTPGGGPLPFRAMLTLPNPPVFARDSDSFFFVAFSTSQSSRELSATIAANAKISLTISCTFRFDPRRAAAHSSKGNDFSLSNGSSTNPKDEEAIWKWHEPPRSPLKRRSVSRKSTQWDVAGSHSTTIRRMTGESMRSGGGTTRGGASRPTSPPAAGEFGEGEDAKPLPELPPPTPTS
ncbi:hypothetical protein M408DRAFT_332882, partial [Serendipita vermifera MAFF 305830]